jgi:hypothetical protein
MRLVYEASGKEVVVGDTVHLDGNAYTVYSFSKPHKPASSGKVFIRPISNENGFSAEYFVGVIGAKWIEREDRETHPRVKFFSNGWGGQKMTRDEYQQQWLTHTGQTYALFKDVPAEFLELQAKIGKLAGVMWDNQE